MLENIAVKTASRPLPLEPPYQWGVLTRHLKAQLGIVFRYEMVAHMKRVSCKVCGAHILGDAKLCSVCGAPRPINWLHVGIYLLASMLGLVVLGVAAFKDLLLTNQN